MATKEKEQKAIHIFEDHVAYDGRPSFGDFVQMIASAMLQIMKTTRDEATESFIKDSNEVVDRGVLTKQVSDDIYDCVNLAFSNMLSIYAPEYDKHPSLTEAAIMKAENEIVEAAANGDEEAIAIVTGEGPKQCEDNSEPAQDAEQN